MQFNRSSFKHSDIFTNFITSDEQSSVVHNVRNNLFLKCVDKFHPCQTIPVTLSYRFYFPVCPQCLSSLTLRQGDVVFHDSEEHPLNDKNGPDSRNYFVCFLECVSLLRSTNEQPFGSARRGARLQTRLQRLQI